MRIPSAGVGLVEVLVALTILVLALGIAFTVYDVARRSFQRGENVAEQQQNVRVAWDLVSSDLRMAGVNHNPDGDATRRDEQIEAAYDTAIVIRGDLDLASPDAVSPEAALGGGAHATVTTGNDEIVTYVLAKPDGSSSDALMFWADVADEPRDGVAEPVRIDRIALVHDDPPYTLYRITLAENVSRYGSSAFVVRQPVVDEIRSMTFRYFDSAGAALNPVFDPLTVGDDIGGEETVAARGSRASVRRIRLELEGVTRDPDPTWTDPTDSDPVTRSRRKFRIAGVIVPRNLGLEGAADPR